MRAGQEWRTWLPLILGFVLLARLSLAHAVKIRRHGARISGAEYCEHNN